MTHFFSVNGGAKSAHFAFVRLPEPFSLSAAKVALTEALGQIGLLVDEDLGADDVAEGVEGLEEVGVAELLGQVVDEQVGAVGTLKSEDKPGLAK